MPNDRKRGYFKFEGSNPMAIVELSDATPEASTPEQEAIATAVSRAIKSYIVTTEALARGKYQHLRDKIPEYMGNPGNVLMAICADGIVVRYEKKALQGRKGVVLFLREGIGHAAAVLSQNLVHIESPEAPSPSQENFGVEIKFWLGSSPQGISQEVLATRIWFQAKSGLPQQAPLLGAKPYCLLSVRNEVAPLWAEHDVLGAALIAQTKDAQLSNLDPRASTRRQYASLLAKFKALLESNPEHEQVLQAFLQEYPILLCPTHTRMWAKLQLGATVTDFVFCDAGQEYILVELEPSTLRLFRNDGHPTARLTHAHGQIHDWKRYLEDNLPTVQRELGLAGITPSPNGLIVMGRSQSLLPENRRKLQTMTSESPRLRIMTYDDVYENAKAVFENLLGPIWDAGGNTQIYYPPGTGG